MTANEPAGGSAVNRDAHLRDYWRVLWRGRWTVAVIFALVVMATAAFTFLQEPVYRGTAVVEIQPQARRVANLQDASGLGAAGYGWFAEEKYQNTQMQIIRSRDVAARAFDSLALEVDPRFTEVEDPVRNFIGMIQVQPRRETGLIEISIDSADRNEAARWANAIAEAYVERNLERARGNALEAVRAIERQFQPLRDRLKEAESERFDILREEEIFNPENRRTIVRERLQTLNERLAQVNLEIGELEILLGKIRDLQARNADPMVLPELADDETLQELNRQKVSLQREFETVKVAYRPGHVRYKEKESQIQTVQSRIREQVSLILGKIQNDYDLAVENRFQIENEIATAEQLDYQVERKASRYELAKTDSETKKRVFELISETLSEVNLGAELLANNVSILDRAYPPRIPVKPKKKINLALGGMFGLFLGVGFVFFLDYLDHTVHSADDVEKYFGLTALAVVPAKRPDERSSRAINEAYQTLKTGLVFSSDSRRKKVCLVTSTAPQEGKSSTIAQLADAIAGGGESVIVIDCDLRRPTQHMHHRIPREPGLTNYLVAAEATAEWRAFVRKGGDGRADVLPAGAIPPNPAELLSSSRFTALLDMLRGVYDWVLIDSPPSLSLADSSLLASLADMTLLVIKHNETDREMIARNVQQLQKMGGGNLIGAVLNNVDVQKAADKGYYYASYYYYDDDELKRQGQRRRRRASREDGTAGAGLGA